MNDSDILTYLASHPGTVDLRTILKRFCPPLSTYEMGFILQRLCVEGLADRDGFGGWRAVRKVEA